MPHDFKNFPELTNNQMQFYYWASPHKQITESFRAKVVKVTDGDTIRVECNFRDFNFPIRFSNTDAPEMDTAAGEKSKSWLENQIMGQEVDIIIDQDNRVEKWGRLLGEVIFSGLNMNEMSMLMGHAHKFGEGI